MASCNDPLFASRPVPDAGSLEVTIYLIRHGLTSANKENRFAGRSEEPLHPEGVAQIEGVARELLAETISRVYCGPLSRTRQSAEIAAGLLSAPVVSRESLNEINIPHWDTLTKDEIRARFGDEYPTWLDNPAGFYVPGCETIAEVRKRAVDCVEEIFSQSQGEKVLVVTHLIVVRSLLLHYLGKPLDEFRSIKVGNAQVVKLTKGAKNVAVEF